MDAQENEDTFRGFNLLQDKIAAELQDWKNVYKTSSEEEERDRASAFVRGIEAILQELNGLEKNRLSEMEDSAITVLGSVDDLWKYDGYPYPQNRMDRLLSSSSAFFAEALARKIKAYSIWNNPADGQVVLLNAVAACNAWIDECHRMTSVFWKNDVQNPWRGEPYKSLNLLKLRDRINQIASTIKTTQLAAQLLPTQKGNLLENDYLFGNFKNLDNDPKQSLLLDNASWKAAVIVFNDNFKATENEIVGVLRHRLASAANINPAALLDTLLQYEELVQRPRIRKELESEGRALMSHAKSWLHSLKSSLAAINRENESSNISTTTLAESSEVLHKMRAVRLLETQATNIQRGVHLFSIEMAEANDFEQEIKVLITELQEQINEIFDSWSRNMLAGIRDQSLSLSNDFPVVTFDDEKLMKINYDSRLVNFVEEVQVLSSMGFKVAPQIVKFSQAAQEFMQQVRGLEKIAKFHNNIGDSMLPVLKPIMLEAAIDLSALVQEQNAVKWSQVEHVNNYVRRLQAAVDRLDSLNKQFIQCHQQIQDKVLKLFDIDLISQPRKWKDSLKEIRLIFGTIEAQGFHHLHAWRLYWDYQLFKAVDKQYEDHLKKGIYKNMSDINIQLDFKKHALRYKPPMEDIRREYYRSLRKFLSLPLHFKGLVEVQPAGTSPIFPKIIDKHSHLFGQAYTASSSFILELDQFKSQFKSVVAPALVDLETIIESELREPEDWDLAFQLAKKKLENSSDLFNDEERVDCFIVSSSPLQKEVNSIHRAYKEALSTTLERSIQRDVTAIDEFTSNGLLLLETQPADIEKFSEFNDDFNELLRSTPEFARLMKKAEGKSQVLSRWTRESLDVFNQACAKWEHFNLLLTGYKEAVGRQMDDLKLNSQSQIIQFTSRIETFYQRWQQERPSNAIVVNENQQEHFERCLLVLQNFRNEWNGMMQDRILLNNRLEKVGENPLELSLITDIEADIVQQESVWWLYKTFTSELNEMTQEDWLGFRYKVPKFEEFLENWSTKLNELQDQHHPILDWLNNQIDYYKTFVPLMKLARGETFTDRHWAEFLTLAGLPSMSIDKVLFRHLLQSATSLSRQSSLLKELNGRAATEAVVRQALAELEQWEAESQWNLTQHLDSGGNQLFIIKEFKELLNKVGENVSLIQSIKDSSHSQAYGDRILFWETKMTDLDFYLRQLSQIQIKWLYLEPVFNRGALLKDAGRFRRLDADFRFLLAEIKRDSRVTSILRLPNLRSLVTNLLDQVGRCQKSLSEFLEEKRSKFARFYFLGDEDLLDIIGQAASKPAVIQTHLKKLFAGIHSVEFSNDYRQILTIVSLEGERVKLMSPVSISGQEVEIWLNKLVLETRSTLQVMLRDCVQERQKGTAADLSRFPSQILCLAEAVLFTERCERAIALGEMSKLKSDYQNQLTTYTIRAPSLQNTSGSENGILALKLQTLVMDIIHYIDVIEAVINSRCRMPAEWAWQKQLRFYLVNGCVVARMARAEMEYTYEYQGNEAKLVHTPLTDRCYLTLTLALRMGLGGNPYGPAGTGKTESVKALGSLLGRQVLVFNCDEGLDVKSMGRIFIGLVKTGAWGCFDEFNRLDENTLSTVSTLIQAIQQALKNKHEKVALLGSQVDVDHNSGIFVTLNPAGKEYGGRQKLPDNLKQLFRPVVMSEPDIELIAEVILYSQGFQNAKVIGKKLVNVFRLAQKLLSRQQHYDWGLRALKSVLRTAGDGLATEQGSAVSNNNRNADEYHAVLRALNFNTLSKLTPADSKLFLSLVADIFPNVDSNYSDPVHSSLVEIINSCYKDMGLMPLDRQVKKILEVYEQARQRMGVVIVGPPSSGKTTVCKLLKMALEQQKRKVRVYTMNPKAISRAQLLGMIDSTTREWTDGVLTKIARAIVSEESDVTSWAIVDGDIDPEWIEALNSVLDDNRLLTMASGERIKFGPDVNFIFETHDLTYASPATISRMGVVYFSQSDIDVKMVIENWLKKVSADLQDSLRSFVNTFLYKAIDWLEVNNGETVMTVSLLSTIRGILIHIAACRTKTQFIYGLIQGGGANLNSTARKTFGQMVLSISGVKAPDAENPFICAYDAKTDSLVLRTSGDFGEQPLDDNNESGGMLLVPTSNLQASYNMIKPWLSQKEHVMLVGPEACGKSLLIRYCVSQLRSIRMVVVHCSSHTTPQDILNQLLQNAIVVSSSKGQVLCPKEASMIVLYLKDVNIVASDKWGTCQLIAFVEQIINYKGCYDANGEWITMDSIQVVCSMNTSHALGRFETSPRFNSLLRIASVGELQLKDLELLTISYLKTSLGEKFADRPSQQVASFMVRFDTEMRSNLASINQLETLFTTRHLTSWAEGMARYEVQWENLSAATTALFYEASRIYRDKLGYETQKNKFDEISKQLFKENWKINPGENIVFSTFRSKKQKLIPTSYPEWEKIISKILQQYGRENEPLDIELLEELLQSVARCDRILSHPYSRSLVLIGRSGTGRHSSMKLLSVLHKARLMTPNPGKSYGRRQFANDLKSAIQAASIDGDRIYFMVEDHHFTDPSFYALIDSLLASGEIPGLYTNEEIETMVTPLKEIAAQENYSGSLLSFHAQRVRANLRIVFIVDPVGQPAYETLIETHPSMYKYSDRIWMENWSRRSMLAVAARIVPESKSIEGMEEVLQKSVEVFESLDPLLKCPRRYVAFVETFSEILNNKIIQNSERQQRIQSGVSKLSEARDLVSRLRAEASQQEQLLEQKQGEAKGALQKITDTIQRAGVKREQMQELQSTITKENVALNQRKKAIDEELAEIEPALIEARSAVSEIRNEALAEIRSLRAPPDVIRDILEGVLRLMGTLDTSWTSMKSFLAKRGVKEEIRSFDARKITTENRRAVEQLLVRRGESFDARVAKRASVAAAPLAAWVQANVSYSKVLERITPLEQEQDKLKKNLQAAEDSMVRLSTGLDDVDKEVAFLREQLAMSTRQASEIEIGLNKARQALSASENLISELAGEYDRWRLQLEELEHNRGKCAVYSLLAAAFINFLASATEDQRKSSLSRWINRLKLQKAQDEATNINNSPFTLKTFLTDEQELMRWRSEGLASDELTVENALSILHGNLYSYILDSSSNSIQWIMAHFKSATVELTSRLDERFYNALDLSIRFGKILLVQDMDSVDPILYPVLRKDYIYQGGRKLLRLGDKVVDVNDNFRLFLFSRSTTLAQTVAALQANSLVNTVNFNSSETGFTDQLITLTIQYENPELEKRKVQLLDLEEQLKLQLAQLEEKLLQTLGESQGNILENQMVLTSLKELKQSSATIAQSLKESSNLQNSLERERLVYGDLAKYGSRLYFAIRDLSKLNSCYQFSSSSFVQTFIRSLKAKKVPDGPEKLSFIQQRLLKTVYASVSRAVFKPDKILAAVHIVREMKPDVFQHNEWEVFVGSKTTSQNNSNLQLPDWIDESRFTKLLTIKTLLPELFSKLSLDDASLWASSATSIPLAVSQRLTSFQQVLAVQAIYPDRLIKTLSEFLSRTLQVTELFPATSTFRTILSETLPEEPILVLLPTEGSGSYDMTAELVELAKDALGTSSIVQEVAMGSEETDRALSVVLEAAKTGNWCCLKNVHLVSSWLPTLDRLLDELQRGEEGSLHRNFRLWMTAEPVSSLPPSLLQRCKKITSEAPQGMKRNLKRTLEGWSSTSLPGSASQLQAQFMLAWFHAIVQERRNYVPQGWLKKHEFNDSDLRISVEILDQITREADAGNRWEYLNGLLFNVIYGGRVDNTLDLQVLYSYLSEFFNEKSLGKNNLVVDHDVAVPLSRDIQDYMACIQNLSENDKCTYVGLPANFDVTVQYNQSLHLSSRLKDLQHQTIVLNNSLGEGQGDSKLLSSKLAPIFALWKSLVQGTALLNNKDHEGSRIDTAENSTPLALFIIAESTLATRLVRTVHQSLLTINRSLKANSPLGVSLTETATEIAAMKTPKLWYGLWEGPMNVEQYLRSLVKRAQALMKDWLPAALNNKVLDSVLDLSQLMSPEAFVSVLHQHTARVLGTPMDSLQLATSWGETPAARSGKLQKVTATLSGIYIQGAQMKRGLKMEDCDVETPSWNSVPYCFLTWLTVEEMNAYRNNQWTTVNVPLYVDEERKRLITVLAVPFATGTAEGWLRAGVALSLKD